MGCGGSSEADSDAPGGSASDGGDIKMFSAGSHALANTKLGGDHYGKASAHTHHAHRVVIGITLTEHSSPCLLTENGES